MLDSTQLLALCLAADKSQIMVQPAVSRSTRYTLSVPITGDPALRAAAVAKVREDTSGRDHCSDDDAITS